MTITTILDSLDGVRKSGKGYISKCPAHEDRSPSLSLMEAKDGRILINCFAGCSPHEVLSSIGLTMSDLFPDSGLGEYRSFQKINDEIKSRKKSTTDEMVLKIADLDRKAGKRLSQEDLKKEQQAFMRARRANPK